MIDNIPRVAGTANWHGPCPPGQWPPSHDSFPTRLLFHIKHLAGKGLRVGSWQGWPLHTALPPSLVPGWLGRQGLYPAWQGRENTPATSTDTMTSCSTALHGSALPPNLQAVPGHPGAPAGLGRGYTSPASERGCRSLGETPPTVPHGSPATEQAHGSTSPCSSFILPNFWLKK